MGVQRLGPKKLRRIETLTGRAVHHAFAGGGLKHCWAEVFFRDGEMAYVNYVVGDYEPVMEGSLVSPWWRAGSYHWNMGEGGTPEGCEYRPHPEVWTRDSREDAP